MTPHNQGGAHVPVVPAHRKLPWRPKFVDVVRTWRPSAATLAARCIQPATRVCGTHPDGRSTASATFPSTRLSTRTHKSLRINNLHIPRPLDTTSDTVRQSCLWSDYHPFPISTHAVPRKVLSRRTAERIDDQQGFHGHHPDQAHPSSPGRSFNNGDRTAPTTALFGHSADTVPRYRQHPSGWERKWRQMHRSPASSSQPATVSAIRTSAGMPRPWCNLRIMPSVKGRLRFRIS